MSLKQAKELGGQHTHDVDDRTASGDLSREKASHPALDQMDVPSRKELNILKLRVDRLERRLSSLEIVLTNLKEPLE